MGLPFDLTDYHYNNATYLLSPGLDIGKLIENNSDDTADLFPFILTNYTLMDPGFSPRGKSSIVLARFCDYQDWTNLDQNKYNKKKMRVQTTMVKLAEKLTGIPFSKAEVIFSASPKTMIHYSGNPFGSAIGMEHTVNQSGIFRFDQKSPIPHLFLVGHDTKPGGGVGSALSSGIIAGNYLMQVKI